MTTASVHWLNGTLYIHVVSSVPVDAPAVVRRAQLEAHRFLGKSAIAYRVGPRRRLMSFRRRWVYTFAAFTTERGAIDHDF
jgi:hypothetical protein